MDVSTHLFATERSIPTIKIFSNKKSIIYERNKQLMAIAAAHTSDERLKIELELSARIEEAETDKLYDLTS